LQNNFCKKRKKPPRGSAAALVATATGGKGAVAKGLGARVYIYRKNVKGGIFFKFVYFLNFAFVVVTASSTTFPR
jgi:hypothetical protein